MATKDASRKVTLDSEVTMTSNSADNDPSTLPRWGYISAKPSEYLVVYRGGRLREEVSGQGGRCFKWPADTVAIIPTTLKEVLFEANQITRDNVDVRLRGMVLYRIAEPLRIYTMLNFSNRQNAEAKLARMLADMCRSIVKWLVANMGVEECVRRRKEEIAQALRREVTSVVSSDGPEGWGVEIVTIDIQDVYIQDTDLFASMQARFKAEKTREAEMARLQGEQEVATQRVLSEQALQRNRFEMQMEKARLDATLGRTHLELNQRQAEEQYKLDKLRSEQAEALERYRLEQEEQREHLKAESARERALIDSERNRILSEEAARSLRERLEAESSAGRASLERLFLKDSLPELARTLAPAMGNMRYSVLQMAGQDGAAQSPLGFALGQILDLLGQRLEPIGEGSARKVTSPSGT